MASVVERVVQRLVAFSARLFGQPIAREITPSTIARVLVVRVDDRVGNVLLTTPLLRALREGLPDARVDWLLAARRVPLVTGLGLAHELIPYDRRRLARNPFKLVGLLLRLRRNRYDVVLEASHHDVFSTTQALLSRVTGAAVRIGADRGPAASFYTHPVPPDPATTLDVPARLRLLGPVGVAPRGAIPETLLGTRPDEQAAADEILRAAGVTGRFVVVNPGSRKLDRRSPAEAFAIVGRAAAERSGSRLLVVWGPGEDDVAREVVDACRTEEGRADGTPLAVLAPPTGLGELAALLRRASMLVTNDTGPSHLGVACEVPVLALFVAGDAQRWGHDLPAFRAIDAGLPKGPLGREARRLAGELLGSGERAA